MHVLIQGVLGRALKFSISDKLPGDPDAAGLWTTLRDSKALVKFICLIIIFLIPTGWGLFGPYLPL